jgi:hypothetical protein
MKINRFEKLNEAYLDLLVDQLNIKNLLLEDISKREVIL